MIYYVLATLAVALVFIIGAASGIVYVLVKARDIL